MIKKEYLAAIVAIAVAVAAVAIFAMGGGNEDGEDDEKESLLPVDKLRTDLRIYDKISFDELSTAPYSYNESTNVTADSILDYHDVSPDMDKATITYKGKEIDCYIYNTPESKKWISVESGLCYVTDQYSAGKTVTTTLVDSNLDLSKKKSEQTLAKGSFIAYEIVDNTLPHSVFTYRNQVHSVNGGGTVNVVHTGDKKESVFHSRTILGINYAGELVVVTSEKTDIDTKAQFLSVISIAHYDEVNKAISEQYGTEIVNKGERKTVLDTKFGKRDVTVRTEASMTSAGIPTVMKIYYGTEGVIYKMEYTEGPATKVTTLVESNLLTVGS